ncbi:MAG: asparagine synthetase B, partial [Bacteroidota bacterium]
MVKRKHITLIIFWLIFSSQSIASHLLIQMDESQKNHLKAYGIAYWELNKQGGTMEWLLNYKGGSFLFPYSKSLESECVIRGVSFSVIADAQANSIRVEIGDPEVNMEVVRMEKAPKVAVYSPKNKLPWDDAVTLALTYAEIPYEIIYDEEIIAGKLPLYDWLHLHHEDFTGQYGKFYAMFRNAPWYQEQVRSMEALANSLGFK